MYSAGSLVYSRSGLVALFGWLLWGDFIFTLMETVISFQSDHLRTRWGRRRPIIFITTPLVVLFLAATPFAPDILRVLWAAPAIRELFSHSTIAPVILLFGLLTACFQLFNMFISSVYYYLIRDVVPEELIGRFFGLFSMFGYSATLIFNYFLFGLAENHLKEIFVVISLAYGIFILLMCWKVKEGTYPPSPPRSGTHWWHGISTYFRECYGYRYYWWVFVTYSALNWGGVGNAFSVFFYREDLHFSLDLIGKMESYTGMLFILLSFPFGILMDRWGCHKTVMLGLSLTFLFSLFMYALAINQISAIIWTLIRTTALNLCSLALAKWTIEVYPQVRYGQFGSAAALFSSVGGIICVTVFAHLLDWVKAYRIFLLWHGAFSVRGLHRPSKMESPRRWHI